MTELRKRGGGGDDRGSAEDMSDKVGDKGTGKRGHEGAINHELRNDGTKKKKKRR